MAGSYFDPTDAPEHRCHQPVASVMGKQGWRCECGKAYVIEKVDHGHDVMPGEHQITLHWRRAPKHDRQVGD